MSLLSELGSMLGGQDAQRLAAGQGDFQSSGSPDTQRIQAMLPHMDPQQLEQVFSQAAQKMDPQEYSKNITPGEGGTNPLGGVGSGGVRTIASAIMQHLSGGMSGGIASRIPGLSTTDPSQMNESEVAKLAQYVQQNHPDIFGRTAAQIGQQRPDLLHSFIGKAGLAIGAAMLASHFLRSRR